MPKFKNVEPSGKQDSLGFIHMHKYINYVL